MTTVGVGDFPGLNWLCLSSGGLAASCRNAVAGFHTNLGFLLLYAGRPADGRDRSRVPTERDLQTLNAGRTILAGVEYGRARSGATGRGRPTGRPLGGRAFASRRRQEDGMWPAALRPGPGKEA
jgi:hypothetical protein